MPNRSEQGEEAVSNLVETSGPRIAMVSTHGYVAQPPPLGAADTGGQVVYVLELSKQLAELGYEVDIWTRRFEEQAEVEVVTERVRILRVPCGGPGFIPKEYLHEQLTEWSEHALELIRRQGLEYQLIDSHYWDGGLAGQALAQALGVPHVHTPHSLGLWKLRQMEKDYAEDRASFEREYNFAERIERERALYAAADLVVATTPPQVEMLRDDYEVDVAKCKMIPPGYDDRRFFPVSEATRQSVRQRLGFSGDVILALGRLATNKGYDLLISAFRLVAERDRDASLYLPIGGATLDDDEKKRLEDLQGLARSLGLEDRIRFGGYIPDAELADYYRAADAFVLSSRYEPFGMTAVEAMACGTPTIVTVHGGLWQALTFGRHALFADPFDPEDLGMMMLKPFRLPRLRARMARMGAHKARSLFSWTGIAHQLLKTVGARVDPVSGVQDTETEWEEPWNDGD
ncbi:MAG: glycosyltransferase [Deltaproteobacteria bacterium]|nr:glycosyltransferase [Deltaproteobacteria bacterium]